MTALSPIGLAALELATEFGFSVFPIYEPLASGACSCGDDHANSPKNVGKHPRNEKGFRLASSHPEQVAEWWTRWPMANIGLYPGASQLLVLDVDGPEGEATARSFDALAVPTLEVITTRGMHRYFRLPLGITIANSARKELDIRAHNGYVLAPPSVHASGRVYEWRGDFDTIAPIPDALLEALLPPPAPAVEPRRYSAPVAAPDDLDERRVLAYADRLGYGLSDGRKTGAFRFAAFLTHDVGLDATASYRFLATWNAYNAPPLADGLLSEIHTNARRYGGRGRGNAA